MVNLLEECGKPSKSYDLLSATETVECSEILSHHMFNEFKWLLSET